MKQRVHFCFLEDHGGLKGSFIATTVHLQQEWQLTNIPTLLLRSCMKRLPLSMEIY